MFPQPESVSVESVAIGGDEDPATVGVFLFAGVLPPLVDRGDREDRGVMVDAYGYSGAVVGQVVDSIRNGRAVSLLGEVIGGHLDRFACGCHPSLYGFGLPDRGACGALCETGIRVRTASRVT